VANNLPFCTTPSGAVLRPAAHCYSIPAINLFQHQQINLPDINSKNIPVKMLIQNLQDITTQYLHATMLKIAAGQYAQHPNFPDALYKPGNLSVLNRKLPSVALPK
jgi:hypothetical protein